MEIANTTEIWKPVVGFDQYEVSSLGRVRRCKPDLHGRGLGNILAQTPRKDGYISYSLHHNGVQSVRLGHRIVCEAFHGPAPSSKWYACHNDGNRANNAAANVRWDTPSGNSFDKVGHGTMPCGLSHPAKTKPGYLPRGESHKLSKLTAREVLNIRSDPRSQSAIAKEYSVSSSLIGMIKARKIWTHI